MDSATAAALLQVAPPRTRRIRDATAAPRRQALVRARARVRLRLRLRLKLRLRLRLRLRLTHRLRPQERRHPLMLMRHGRIVVL